MSHVTRAAATPPVPPERRGGNDPGVDAPARGARVIPTAAAFALAAGVALALAAAHLTQGTSSVGAMDLVRLALGADEDGVARVLVASRLPRLLAAVTVGVALGVAGAGLQSVARNPLASPDTLGVNAGAHLSVVTAAALGFSLPALPAGALAFLGGLVAAGLVLAVSSGGAAGPTRLILAGTATALALSSLTMLFLLLYERETTGLFAWGNGSLVQTDLSAVSQLAPAVTFGVIASMLIGPRLDILALGDDAAAVLGIHVRRTRLVVIVLAVMLSATAVTLAGPIGFVGLCAPVIVRLLSAALARVTGSASGLHQHRALLPLSGLVGVVIVVGADIAVRAALGGQGGVDIPAGVATTMFGAVVLVWLARRLRDSNPARRLPGGRAAAVRSRGFLWGVGAVCVSLVSGAAVAGMLLGDTWVLTGDVANWLGSRTGPALTFVLDQRYPRVAAALGAGAALAIAGATVQAVCRNPLAEPSVLGITAGAGVGAVSLITFVPLAGIGTMSSVAGGSALLTFAAVYGLSWRGGLNSDRLVLVGIGASMGCTALITFIIVASDPWNTAKALTWLSGSTYGRTPEQVLPVAVALVLSTPLLVSARRELDLLSLDEDTPRVLGVRLERTRLLALGAAALLTSTAVSAVGVVGFVGLVAPHVARALAGGRHARVLPIAALLGALLVSVADTVGRTVIAPAQIPAGLLTAMIGTPYFVWLLWRSRVRPVG